MISLVSELQACAINSDATVNKLLRMAKIVAAKLDLTEFRKWVDLELDGYTGDEVPQYRVIMGQVKAFNPYVGLIPVNFGDTDIAQDCSTRTLCQKIAELEVLGANSGDMLYVPFSDSQQILLQRHFRIDFEFKLVIASSAITGILDSVRNLILDWSLRLEKAGIRGEGMTFSKEDKDRAQSPTVLYQIGSIASFTGNLGPVRDHGVVNASSSVGVDTAGILNLIAELRECSDKMNLDDHRQAELKETLDSLQTAVESQAPEPSRIVTLFAILKKVLVSAASSLVVHGALSEIDKYSQYLPKF